MLSPTHHAHIYTLLPIHTHTVLPKMTSKNRPNKRGRLSEEYTPSDSFFVTEEASYSTIAVTSAPKKPKYILRDIPLCEQVLNYSHWMRARSFTASDVLTNESETGLDLGLIRHIHLFVGGLRVTRTLDMTE